MRLLFASLMAVTAVAFAAPSFAQDDPTATPTTTTTPTPAAKPAKHKSTASSCSALKSESAKASCLKRTRTAHATTKTPHKTTTKKVAAAKQSSPSQLSPVAEPTNSAPASSGSVSVPPLPQKTI
jgi:hypothetical protein